MLFRVLIAAAGFAASLAATAQVTTLRIHSFSAPQALDQTKHLNPWAEKVTKESGGKLKVEVYPGMQLGGKPADLPKDFYSSKFLVDRLIRNIDTAPKDGKPFFAYLPFLAIHIPTQAPQAYVDKYKTAYAHGWDVQRQRRPVADAPQVARAHQPHHRPEHQHRFRSR